MTAILHCIIRGIEDERMKYLLSTWKTKKNYKKQCEDQRIAYNDFINNFNYISSWYDRNKNRNISYHNSNNFAKWLFRPRDSNNLVMIPRLGVQHSAPERVMKWYYISKGKYGLNIKLN